MVYVRRTTTAIAEEKEEKKMQKKTKANRKWLLCKPWTCLRFIIFHKFVVVVAAMHLKWIRLKNPLYKFKHLKSVWCWFVSPTHFMQIRIHTLKRSVVCLHNNEKWKYNLNKKERKKIIEVISLKHRKHDVETLNDGSIAFGAAAHYIYMIWSMLWHVK